jgi:outer membrane protein assembly factor BamB
MRSVVNCLDLKTGKTIWKRTFDGEFERPYPRWGASNSPLIEGNLCIVGVGTEDDGGLAALDKDTGKTVWTLKSVEPAYSSPVVADLAGERQVICLMRENLVGVSPTKGIRRWQIPYCVKYDQNVITPVIYDNLVFYSGWQKDTECAMVLKEGERIRTEKRWSNKQISFFMSSPVIYAGHLFGFAQRRKGTLVCLDLRRGEVKWSSPGRMGDYVSIVRVGNKLLVLTTKGELLVVAADPAAYRVLHRKRVAEEPVWAHLAVTADRIYVKDKQYLSSLSLTP